MRLLLVDNYDSFTFNLYQYLAGLGASVDVHLHDAIDVATADGQGYDGIVISPGPGRPEDAGISLALVERMAGRTPILGVCLGHQAIAQAYGGKIVEAPTLMHGKTSAIEHDGSGVFRGLPAPFEATRYHSLVVDPSTVPDGFRVNAKVEAGDGNGEVIMGLVDEGRGLHGVQFHPESVLTLDGQALLANFLDLARTGLPAAS